MEVPDTLQNAVTRFPDRVCVVEGDRARTFAEVNEQADRAVTAFRDLGLRRGDRVAILAENELEYVELPLATVRAGLIFVPLNFRLTVPELVSVTRGCAPRLLIHGAGYARASEQLDIEHTWHLGPDGTGDAYDARIAAATPADTEPLVDAAAPAAIMYTSGTTGSPRGALISCGAVWARANLMVAEAQIRSGDVFVQALPMFHIAAHTAVGFTYQGATVVLLKGFDPAETIRVMAGHRATHVLLVPTMINLLTLEPSLPQADLSQLRMVMYGASPMPPQVLRRALDLLPGPGFLQFFGMTETFGASLLRPADHDPNRFPERLASAGTDSVSFRTRVVDASDTDLPPGVVGQVLSRGPTLMDGYWNDRQATIEALRGGWMHTGDLGYRSHDGYLYITDRVKDMVVSGGENVYPREIEDVLYEHPAVLDAAVLGIPDRRWGERVHALVVLKADQSADGTALLAHCRERLAGYKVPKSVEFIDDLPRNATGKVLKHVLRERFWHSQDRRVG